MQDSMLHLKRKPFATMNKSQKRKRSYPRKIEESKEETIEKSKNKGIEKFFWLFDSLPMGLRIHLHVLEAQHNSRNMAQSWDV